jgi:flagellar basal-body rod protein FlgB
MSSTPTDVFALAEQRLAWIGQRQSVLAQNIANVNTPGYAARDVKPFSEFLAARTQQSDGDYLAPISNDADSSADKTAAGRSIDGNAVVLDQQLERIAETDTAHQLAANLYKKYVGLFKTAIGRN